MTTQELKQSFLILYDKIAGLSAPGVEDSEIEFLLNKAQLQFVKNHYNHKNNKSKEGIEETEDRRKELSELINNAILTVSVNQTGVFPNGTFYQLPNDVLYVLNEYAFIPNDPACTGTLFNQRGEQVTVKPITHDEYNNYIENPFKKPSRELIWRMDFNDKRHELITDGTAITQYIIRYIKTPSKIDLTNGVTSELNPIVHDEIVDIAVRMATAITSQSEYQLKAIEQQINE